MIEPKFECEYQDEITCPYCGYKHEDSWEKEPDGDSASVHCDSCSKQFHLNVERSVSYTSICGGYDNDGNDLDCDFIDDPTEAHPDHQICKRCGNVKFKRFDK